MGVEVPAAVSTCEEGERMFARHGGSGAGWAAAKEGGGGGWSAAGGSVAPVRLGEEKRSQEYTLSSHQDQSNSDRKKGEAIEVVNEQGGGGKGVSFDLFELMVGEGPANSGIGLPKRTEVKFTRSTARGREGRGGKEKDDSKKSGESPGSCK